MALSKLENSRCRIRPYLVGHVKSFFAAVEARNVALPGKCGNAAFARLREEYVFCCPCRLNSSWTMRAARASSVASLPGVRGATKWDRTIPPCRQRLYLGSALRENSGDAAWPVVVWNTAKGRSAGAP